MSQQPPPDPQWNQPSNGEQGYQPGYNQPSGYTQQPGYGNTNINVNVAQPTGEQAKGFFAALFDYSFQTYITPKLVKVVYILVSIMAAVMYIGYVIAAFQLSSALGVLVLLILGPIAVILTLAIYRVFLEFFMAVIRMSDDIHRRLPPERGSSAGYR